MRKSANEAAALADRLARKVTKLRETRFDHAVRAALPLMSEYTVRGKTVELIPSSDGAGGISLQPLNWGSHAGVVPNRDMSKYEYDDAILRAMEDRIRLLEARAEGPMAPVLSDEDDEDDTDGYGPMTEEEMKTEGLGRLMDVTDIGTENSRLPRLYRVDAVGDDLQRLPLHQIRATSSGHFGLILTFDERVILESFECHVGAINIENKGHITGQVGQVFTLACSELKVLGTHTASLTWRRANGSQSVGTIIEFVLVRGQWDGMSYVCAPDGSRAKPPLQITTGESVRIMRSVAVDPIVAYVGGLPEGVRSDVFSYGHVHVHKDGGEYLVFLAPGDYRVGFLTRGAIMNRTLRDTDLGTLIQVRDPSANTCAI